MLVNTNYVTSTNVVC